MGPADLEKRRDFIYGIKRRGLLVLITRMNYIRAIGNRYFRLLRDRYLGYFGNRYFGTSYCVLERLIWVVKD